MSTIYKNTGSLSFTDEHIEINDRRGESHTLYRVVAADNIYKNNELIAKKGTEGGFLSKDVQIIGNTWVGAGAMVYNLVFLDNSMVTGHVIINNGVDLINCVVNSKKYIKIENRSYILNSEIEGNHILINQANIERSVLKGNILAFPCSEIWRSKIYGFAIVPPRRLIYNKEINNNNLLLRFGYKVAEQHLLRNYPDGILRNKSK